MNILSIEAASNPASVAVSVDDQINERVCDDPRAQAENLLGLVDDVLRLNGLSTSDVDAFAVGRGPGSFTGLRVAAALTQGLAYSLGKPVANVSSLAAMAHLAMAEAADSSAHGYPVLVCLDARKSQVYCALYEADEQCRAVTISPEVVLDPDEVVATFRGLTIVGIGNGFDQYPELSALDLHATLDCVPSARAVALRAASGSVTFAEPYLATPKYVRDKVTHGA